MFVSTKVNVVVAKPIEETFDRATNMAEFNTIFTGWGPISGNLRAEQLDKGRPKPGSRRRMIHKDGSATLEEIHQFSRPNTHRYRVVSGLPKTLGMLVDYGEAVWRFKSINGGTSVTWEYKFKVKNIAVVPGTTAMVKLPYHRAMQRCLNNLRNELENQ